VAEPSLPCSVSRLTIPGDPRYAEAASRYAETVARLAGFDAPAREEIVFGLQTALPALMRYSFEPGEPRGDLEVVCELVPAGLQIVLRDKGLPFGCSGPASPPAECVPDGAILSLREHFDEIHFSNLGPEGKEIVLIKHRGDRALAEDEAACRLDPPDAAEAARPLPHTAHRCTIRSFGPADAVEISKTVYRTYGYSYSHDYVYYPEKIIALNASGEVQSALAVSEQNAIVGHCALSLWGDNPQIGELGQGVVVPDYRSQGCFAQLTEHLIAAARQRGLKGVLSEAVTVHPFSQKTALQHGLRDCALFVGLVPPRVEFKGMGGGSSRKGSILVQFKHLEPPAPAAVYAPARHAGMLQAIYANLDPPAAPSFKGLPANADAEGEPAYTLRLLRSLNLARIRVDRCGPGILADIRLRLRELCLQRWDIIHLVLNLADPPTALFCERFEELGFFFAGVLPLGLSSGDALVLQYLNIPRVPYSAIRTASPFAADLAAYVQSCDPNPTAG
jgi:serine/threonine-protein kinase RsbW